MAYENNHPAGSGKDTDEAILWYESQQKGLGMKFYSLLLERLEELKFNPQYYFNIYKDFRRITV